MAINSDLTLLINILKVVKVHLTEDSDFIWTSYDNAEELNSELDSYLFRLVHGDNTVIKDIYLHFLPTGTFQEHAITNNWSDEYMDLAEQFDKIYARN